MMKKIFNFQLILSFALLCGLSFSVISCKDDNKNDENSGQQSGTETSEGQDELVNAAFSVLDQLADLDDAGENFLNQQYEPNIGMPEDDNEGIRIVNTNTMELAVLRFNDLTGAEIDENTTSYEWSNKKIGKMTYTKGDGSTSWATVDVDIKQMPHLQKIIYRSPSQSGDNGSFTYAAYYRFGDVVSREVKNKAGETVTEYWICVRPAFGLEKKGDSHWVCLNVLPEKNVREYSNNGETWYLPTGLTDSKEHMQNLAEMLYAMLHPVQWEQNVTNKNNKKLTMFHDFDKSNVKYHNEYFWGSVARAWDEKGLWTKIFGSGFISRIEVRNMLDNPNQGLHLLYNGYSWPFKPKGKCNFWEAVYTNGTGVTANMHDAKYTTPEKDIKGMKVDWRTLGDGNTDIFQDFFGDKLCRWPVRVATGKDLCTGKYSAKEAISGVQEVYRYYRDVLKRMPSEPEKTEFVVYNAPDEGVAGTYLPGDVITNITGHAANWFCINGSPYTNTTTAFSKNHDAWFISFDYELDMGPDGILVKEKDLPEVTLRFLEFIGYIEGLEGEYGLDLRNKKLGKIGQHILDYTGVDLTKLFSPIDSTWTFTSCNDGKTYSSKSTSYAFNIVYQAEEGGSAIARIILDRTQAGTQRKACHAASGKTLADWRCLCFKHYENYADYHYSWITDDEKSVGMTDWQGRWFTTEDKMQINDVTNQAMVDKYAPYDKWQKTSRRTKAEESIKLEDYLYWNGNFRTNKTSIFNEPVLVICAMKIKDNGGRYYPNLKSYKDHTYTIKHLQNDYDLYLRNAQSATALPYSSDCQDAFYIDNRQVEVKQIDGFEELYQQ